MLPRPLALQRDKKSWKDVRTDGAEGRRTRASTTLNLEEPQKP